MFRNVLVGVDGSAASDKALAEAIDIARESSGRIGILAVVPTLNWCVSTSPVTPPVSRAQLIEDLEADARRHVEEADRAIPSDLPVTKLIAHGNEAEALLTHVRNGPWDLVVLGRHSCFDRLTLRGRLGARLARRSPVPVLIVPPTSSAPRHGTTGRVTAYPDGAAAATWSPRLTVTSGKGGWRSPSSRSRSN